MESFNGSHNQGLDQAERLRRMLGPGTLRIISFIRRPPAQRTNFTKSRRALVQTEVRVHLLDASQLQDGISSCAASPSRVFCRMLRNKTLLRRLRLKSKARVSILQLSREPISQMATAQGTGKPVHCITRTQSKDRLLPGRIRIWITTIPSYYLNWPGRCGCADRQYH